MKKFQLPSKGQIKNSICKFAKIISRKSVEYHSLSCRFLDKLLCKSDMVLVKSSLWLQSFLIRARSFRVRTIAASLSAVFCLTATVAAYAAERTPAVEVLYNGHSVGFVADKTISDDIIYALDRHIYDDIDFFDFDFKESAILGNHFSTPESISQKIMKYNLGVEQVFGLFVNGENFAVAESAAVIQDELSKGIELYTTDGFIFSGFNNDVEIREIYVTDSYAEKMQIDSYKLLNGQYNFGFVTERTEKYEEVIESQEVVKFNEKCRIGYQKTTQKGKDGLKRVVANVQYVNGVKYSVDEIESEIIEEVKDEIIVKGTRKATLSKGNYILASKILNKESAKFTFPVKLGSETYISGFWGDGRNHKGIDIAAPKRTEVYAACSGTVTQVCKRSDYGNVIVIDHGDGEYKTLYAHNTKNLVKVGDKVEEGQLIATVGSTGYSTGNHLHFSVIKNGVMVDPAPYIGIM